MHCELPCWDYNLSVPAAMEVGMASMLSRRGKHISQNSADVVLFWQASISPQSEAAMFLKDTKQRFDGSRQTGDQFARFIIVLLSA